MILALRRRHRLMVSLLAPVVLAGAGLALAARGERPLSEADPRALLGQLPSDRFGAPSYTLIGGQAYGGELVVGLDVRFVRDQGRRFVELAPHGDPGLPDVLVYADDGPGAQGGLPAEAVLLGTLAGAAPLRLELPAGVSDEPRIVLYSLGHQTVVGASLVRVTTGGG